MSNKKIIKLLTIILLVSSTLSHSIPVSYAIGTNNNLTLNKTIKTMTVGSTYLLKVRTTSKPIIWYSSDKATVAVTSSGKVTALKSGVAVIYAKVNSLKLSCKIISKSTSNSSFDIMIKASGYSYDKLDSEQLLIIKSNHSNAIIYFYEANKNGQWVKSLSTYRGYVGKKGITKYKKEGDKKTPSGLYPLNFAFGNKTLSNTAIKYRKITPYSYWVDDVSSKYYNQWVEGLKHNDWNSAEHLSNMVSSYAYAIAVGYNTNPIVKSKGSAIFFHCGNKATSGCITTSTYNIVKIIKKLSNSKHPKILIY